MKDLILSLDGLESIQIGDKLKYIDIKNLLNQYDTLFKDRKEVNEDERYSEERRQQLVL